MTNLTTYLMTSNPIANLEMRSGGVLVRTLHRRRDPDRRSDPVPKNDPDPAKSNAHVDAPAPDPGGEDRDHVPDAKTDGDPDHAVADRLGGPLKVWA